MSRASNSLAAQRASDINRAKRKTQFPSRDMIATTWNRHVPKSAHDAIFPHWQDESAITLRQIIEWADDDLEWLLVRIRCDRDTFMRIAYGVISDSDVTVDWWNDTAAKLNAAVSDMQRQRLAELEAIKNLSTYWSDLDGPSATTDAVPANVVRLTPRETEPQS